MVTTADTKPTDLDKILEAIQSLLVNQKSQDEKIKSLVDNIAKLKGRDTKANDSVSNLSVTARPTRTEVKKVEKEKKSGTNGATETGVSIKESPDDGFSAASIRREAQKDASIECDSLSSLPLIMKDADVMLQWKFELEDCLMENKGGIDFLEIIRIGFNNFNFQNFEVEQWRLSKTLLVIYIKEYLRYVYYKFIVPKAVLGGFSDLHSFYKELITFDVQENSFLIRKHFEFLDKSSKEGIDSNEFTSDINGVEEFFDTLGYTLIYHFIMYKKLPADLKDLYVKELAIEYSKYLRDTEYKLVGSKEIHTRISKDSKFRIHYELSMAKVKKPKDAIKEITNGDSKEDSKEKPIVKTKEKPKIEPEGIPKEMQR